MAYYRTCPYCGAALDPGEQCDCKDVAARERAEAEEFFAKEDTGQMAFRLGDIGERRRA